MQAIILAGGFGTRLKELCGDLPKPMLPIAGRPLLAWQLERLHARGITEAVLCLHHNYHAITDYFGENFAGMRLHYSVEDRAMGTGGAIRAALRMLKTRQPLFVLHADAVADVNIRHMRAVHMSEGSTVTMATRRGMTRNLRLVVDAGHAVACDISGSQEIRIGSIGAYVISPWLFDGCLLPRTFSFEKDFLARYMSDVRPLTYDAVHYFLDIDTPQDYQRAQVELPQRLGVAVAAA